MSARLGISRMDGVRQTALVRRLSEGRRRRQGVLRSLSNNSSLPLANACLRGCMNEIVQENAIVEGRTDKSYWDADHSTQIEGFATDISVNAGTRVDFKINVNGGAGSDYKVEIFRLGYYGGNGAREVAEWTNTNATVQPNCARRRRNRLGRRRQLVGDRRLERAGRRRLRRLPRARCSVSTPTAIRSTGRQPDPVHRPQRRRSRPTSCCRPRTRPGRPTMAGAATNGQVGANFYGDNSRHASIGPTFPAPAATHRIAPTRSATIGRSSPAMAPPSPRAPRTIYSARTMLRSTGSRRTDTTSPTSPASTPTGSGPTT